MMNTIHFIKKVMATNLGVLWTVLAVGKRTESPFFDTRVERDPILFV